VVSASIPACQADANAEKPSSGLVRGIIPLAVASLGAWHGGQFIASHNQSVGACHAARTGIDPHADLNRRSGR
jgi:hypothetical protein